MSRFTTANEVKAVTAHEVINISNTVQRLEHDGRFSIGNKAWAKGYGIPENINRGDGHER